MNSEETRSSSTGIYDLLAWLEVNKKRLAIGLGVAAAAGFVVWIYGWARDQKETKASAELLNLRTPITSTNAPPIPGSAFLKVANEFPSTDAGTRALLIAAGAFYSENNYTEAQKQFQEFLSRYSESPWAGSAAYGVAACLESQDKREEALAAYQGILSRHPNDAVVPDVKMALARIYEAKNQPELALKMYEELAKGTTQTPRGNEAMIHKEQLLKKHPELVNTTNTTSTATVTGSPTTISAPAKTPASNVTVQLKSASNAAPQITPTLRTTNSVAPAVKTTTNAAPK